MLRIIYNSPSLIIHTPYKHSVSEVTPGNDITVGSRKSNLHTYALKAMWKTSPTHNISYFKKLYRGLSKEKATLDEFSFNYLFRK